MFSFRIKTHRLNQTYSQPHFFILNKGLNSGKPLTTPCPNCFVCLTAAPANKEFMYWLSYGLWKSKSFHFYLKGSVIPFITIHDVKKHLQVSGQTAKENEVMFQKSIDALKGLDQHEQTLKKSLVLIETARKAIFYKLMVK